MALIHPLTSRLSELHTRLLAVTDGQLATYIPALAQADPGAFAMSLTTTEGQQYGAGDVNQAFTIQSVSKPFVYALALADSGLDRVLARIGTEPTGDAFNAVTLEDGTGRPLNPMVNAGAIEAACLVAGDSVDKKRQRILDGLSAFAGRILEIDDDVYASESETGDRNRALAYLMQGAGALSLPVEQALAVYFAQCSITVTSSDLAVMAATLARGGVNPVSGERVIPAEVVSPVLSVMATCGMYDAAGTWLFRVGLPAKSGVSGGVLAVLPGQFGLGVWSPPLDVQGNSVRGVLAAQELSSGLGLHMLSPTGPSTSPVRRWTTGQTRRSVSARTTDQVSVLDREGHRVQVVEMQGALHDLAVESLTRRLLDAAESDQDGAHWLLVLDATHVSSVHPQAVSMLDDLVETLARRGAQIAVVEQRGHRPHVAGARIGAGSVSRFDDLDDALAAMEDRVLAEHRLPRGVPDHATPLEEHQVLLRLSDEHREILAEHLVTRVVPAGTIVLEAGSAPDGLVWISAGEASVLVRTPRGRWRRVSGVGAGAVLGEMSMIDQQPRSARVVSDTPALLRVLDGEAVETLREKSPDVYTGVVVALAQLLSHRLRHATTVIRALQE